jgi:hypothetical protein
MTKLCEVASSEAVMPLHLVMKAWAAVVAMWVLLSALALASVAGAPIPGVCFMGAIIGFGVDETGMLAWALAKPKRHQVE